MVKRCLDDDDNIKGYFERGFVQRQQVVEMLTEGKAFDQATQTSAYFEYRSPRSEVTALKGLRNIISGTTRLSTARRAWLNDSAERIIIPNAVLTINTLLGKDKDKLLVERDSEGLRRLQDPAFRVSTHSRERLDSILSQMDGGSIALAGPRGAGKSTLLKQFCQPTGDDLANVRGILVYVPAPSEYVARDFIAELFQRLCEAYLEFCNYPRSEALYGLGKTRASLRRTIHKALALAWLSLRVMIAVALVASASWLLIRNIPGVVLGRTWSATDRLYLGLGIVLLAWAFWPKIELWRRHLRSQKEPGLVQQAREYLLRLQVDKTVTWGANVTSPGVRGIGLGMSKGTSAKYTPWTLPELVGYVRRFMDEISKQLRHSSRAVIIGIDEIDRIGSLDHAERFIGEIKAIFGIERCFFLVAVAEDVGSLFARRATAGRSILESAFDEVITVDPLKLDEARDLLLKRVPGFTDAFVYLVFALSGGLPRELIRVTRRLVEVNLEQLEAGRHPRLDDLAFRLVTEDLIDVLVASRSQMSRLILSSGWAALFDEMRSAGITLRRGSAPRSELYKIMENISAIRPPKTSEREEDQPTIVQDDEDTARRIVAGLSAFAYFGVTVIDAFADEHFSLDEVRQRMESDDGASYQELAAARVELSISTTSAQLILHRFHDSLAPNAIRNDSMTETR